jgi:pimeloyl-ACP methyl ester carboxylesterase
LLVALSGVYTFSVHSKLREGAERELPDRARAVIIKEAGHFPHIEKPETVNELLSEWLEEKVNRS